MSRDTLDRKPFTSELAGTDVTRLDKAPPYAAGMTEAQRADVLDAEIMGRTDTPGTATARQRRGARGSNGRG